MVAPVPPRIDAGSGRSPSSGERTDGPSASGQGEDGLSAWPDNRSWAADRDSPAATAFLFLVVAIAVVTVAALLAGGAGSPAFSVGLALGVGVGAVPYLLFCVAHVGWSYSFGAGSNRHRRLTEDEWQRLFGAGTAGQGFTFGSSSRPDETGDAYARTGTIDPGQMLADAYEALGVSAGASLKDVRTAYHRLAHRHHPDKVAGQSEEARRLAEERMKQLNAAYDLLRKRSH